MKQEIAKFDLRKYKKSKTIIMCLLLVLSSCLMLVGCNKDSDITKDSFEFINVTKSDNTDVQYIYHDNNIQALSSHFETELAEEILSGLEKTNVLKENTRLNSDWIVKRDTNTFELYNDFSIIISINNNKFKIFTYETVYDEAAAILLYDSANPAETKILSETEREEWRSKQRKYQVQSTLDISPSFGALLHDQWGNTYFSFSVKNKSDSSFVYIDITFMPSFPGYEGELKKKTYTSWDEIKIGESKEFELKTTGWGNYDFFEVTNIVIMFDDGTSVQFNEYDCQFLKD